MIAAPTLQVLDLVEQMNNFLFKNLELQHDGMKKEPPKVKIEYGQMPNIDTMLDQIYIDPEDILRDFNEYFMSLQNKQDDDYENDQFDRDISSKSQFEDQIRKMNEEHNFENASNASVASQGNFSRADSDFKQAIKSQVLSPESSKKPTIQVEGQKGPATNKAMKPDSQSSSPLQRSPVDKMSEESKTVSTGKGLDSKIVYNTYKEFFKNESEDMTYTNREQTELKKYVDFNLEKVSSTDYIQNLNISIHESILQLVKSSKTGTPGESEGVGSNALLENMHIQGICMWNKNDSDGSVQGKINSISGQIVAVMRNHPEGFEAGTHKIALYNTSRKETIEKSLKIVLGCSLECTYDLGTDVFKQFDCCILSQKPGKVIIQIPISTNEIMLKHITINPFDKLQKITEDHSVRLATKRDPSKRLVKMSQDGNWSGVLLDDHKIAIFREVDKIDSSFKHTTYSDIKQYFQEQETIHDFFLEPIEETERGPSLVMIVLSSLQYVYLVRVFPQFKDKKKDFSSLTFSMSGKFHSKLKSEDGFEDHKVNGIAIDSSKDIIFIVSNFRYDSAKKFGRILKECYDRRKSLEQSAGLGYRAQGDDQDQEVPQLEHPEWAENRMVMIRCFQIQGNLKKPLEGSDSKQNLVIGSYQSPLLWPAFCKANATTEQIIFYTNRDLTSAIEVAIFGIKGFYNIFAAEYSKMTKGKGFLEIDDDVQNPVGIDLEFCNLYFDFKEAVVDLSIRPEPALRANKLKINSVGVALSQTSESHSNLQRKIMPDLFALTDKGSMMALSVFARAGQEVDEEGDQ